MPGDYNRTDHFYQKAKAEGFRSRAAYKLLEIDKKYGLLKPGFRVLDLGCWPGGWLQAAAQRVTGSGVVVGIDLVEVEPFPDPQIKTITGDVRDEGSLNAATQFAGGIFDVVLSDMSPKLSGIRERDRAAALDCAELALDIAGLALRSDGSLVIKVFKSNEAEQFIRTSRPLFKKVARLELDASRKTSTEFYFIGLGFTGLK